MHTVQVWADGELVTSSDDPAESPDVWLPRGPDARVVLRPGVYKPEPGPVGITASLWDFQLNGEYRAAAVTVAGDPAPFVLPTVPLAVTPFPALRFSLFNTRPDVVAGEGNIPAFLAAGITHLETTAFLNPAGNPTWVDLPTWRTQVLDGWIKPKAQQAINAGFRLTLIGDSFLRTEEERLAYSTIPYMEETVRETAAYFASLAECDAIEMVDEAGPFPADYEPALSLFLQWWRGEGGPPEAWPVIGTWAPPYEWDDPARGGYSSRYLPQGLAWRSARPGGGLSGWQRWVDADRNLTGVPPWGLSALVSAMGPAYRKLAPGGDYRPGLDELDQIGVEPRDIVCQAWLAAAFGARAWRFYGYDFFLWRQGRANADLGQGELQTGVYPGDARWEAMAVAIASLKARAAALVAGPVYEPVASGPWLFGRSGGLVWGVNTSERELPSPSGPGVVVSPAGEAAGSQVPAGCVAIWE